MIGPGDSDYLRFDRRVTDEAEAWLGDPARKAGGWAVFVSCLSPHYPLIAPPEYYALYDPAEFESDAEPVPDHPILREVAGFFSHDEHFSRIARGIARASYYALCSFMDAQVGRVLDALDAAGLADDTLVLFTSDHGEMLGEKGFWTKTVMYDSSARVPLLMAGPGIEPGVRADPVSLIDIAPTIAAAMGAQGEFTGRDLRVPDPDRTVISEYHDGGASVGITLVRWNAGGAAWKLVHYAEGHQPQLFNLTEDPGETYDRATGDPARVAEGMARLRAFCDPEAVNARAHADQAHRIAELGGRALIEAEPQWNFTPADSR
jgi:choline-sulfatase